MIKIWFRALAIGLLGLTALVTLLMTVAWTMLPPDGVAIRLHGATFSLADLQGGQAALFFLFAVATVVIGSLAVLAMIAIGVCVGALGLAVGVLATASSLALVVAPFALVGWLLWRLLRARPVAGVVAAP